MRAGVVGWPPKFAERYVRAGYWTGRPLGSDILARAADRPDDTAVVDGRTRITYRELALLTDGLAENLARRGLSAGDTALVQLPNCWEFVVLTLACLRLGIAPIMALPALRSRELRQLAELGDAAAVVVPDSVGDFDHQAMGLGLAAEVPSLRHVLVAGDAVDEDAADLRALIEPPADPAGTRARLDAGAPRGRDVAVFLLSGGTTGTPKIIPRTHDDYRYNARRCVEMTRTDDNSVYLAALPAGHNFTLACPGILGTLGAGGKVVLARTPEPYACFELIRSEGVTVTSAVPAVAQRWIDTAEEASPDLSTLRVLQVGGSRMPTEIARRVRPVLGATLQQAFGMAEGLINFTRLDDPEDVICETQGRPICRDDEVLLVDEDDEPVPDGESGMLLARGPYTLRGYYRAEEHNARAFTPDGWYRSGDVAHWHPSGNLVVDGRTKDVIIRSGEKISAEEVENLVYAVGDVAQVAAVAAADPDVGERVCVFVVPRPGAEPIELTELRRALTELGTARYKLPELLEVVDTLPATAVGKIDKKRLRNELARKAGPGVQADTATR
jgi:2,3-dihydroxybenzoate-AMP ligase